MPVATMQAWLMPVAMTAKAEQGCEFQAYMDEYDAKKYTKPVDLDAIGPQQYHCKGAIEAMPWTVNEGQQLAVRAWLDEYGCVIKSKYVMPQDQSLPAYNMYHDINGSMVKLVNSGTEMTTEEFVNKFKIQPTYYITTPTGDVDLCFGDWIMRWPIGFHVCRGDVFSNMWQSAPSAHPGWGWAGGGGVPSEWIGPQGPQGPQGPKGDKGDPAPAGPLSDAFEELLAMMMMKAHKHKLKQEKNAVALDASHSCPTCDGGGCGECNV